ncbi:MAG: thermonuclease family protein [Chloroflexota bacterium]
MRRLLIALLIFASACTADLSTSSSGGTVNPGSTGSISGDTAQVTRIIDGDTIDVEMGGVRYRVRYIGMNTPERDQACYQDATDANAALLSGKTVTLVKDTSETDQYGRLLRYVYVGNLFVNAELVKEGWAENAVYPPDTKYEDTFHQLELQARQANIGCHPSGIFNDGSDTR